MKRTASLFSRVRRSPPPPPTFPPRASLTAQDVFGCLGRPSLAQLDPTVARAIISYLQAQSLPAEQLQALRASTRRPRGAAEQAILVVPEAALERPMSPDEAPAPASVLLPRGHSVQDASATPAPPRLLETRLSETEHQAYLQHRLLSTLREQHLFHRWHFVAGGNVSADVGDSRRQLRQQQEQERRAVQLEERPGDSVTDAVVAAVVVVAGGHTDASQTDGVTLVSAAGETETDAVLPRRKSSAASGRRRSSAASGRYGFAVGSRHRGSQRRGSRITGRSLRKARGEE